MKQEMVYKKSTKGTHVYECSKDDAVVPTLYVRKHFFKGEAPKAIVITVEELS